MKKHIIMFMICCSFLFTACGINNNEVNNTTVSSIHSDKFIDLNINDYKTEDDTEARDIIYPSSTEEIDISELIECREDFIKTMSTHNITYSGVYNPHYVLKYSSELNKYLEYYSMYAGIISDMIDKIDEQYGLSQNNWDYGEYNKIEFVNSYVVKSTFINSGSNKKYCIYIFQDGTDNTGYAYLEIE